MLLKISDKIIGYEKEINFFLDLFKKNILPKTLMLTGSEGIGKYTLALHLVNLFIGGKKNNIEESLNKNLNVLILKKKDTQKEYRLEDINKIKDFCKYKFLDNKPKYIVLKNYNFLNDNSVNSLLKLTEEQKTNLYFVFTSNTFDKRIETLESRFFIKKIFLKTSYYEDIFVNFINSNNIENMDYDNINKDTPGNFIRKKLFELNPDLYEIKKNDEILFYKIFSSKILHKPSLNNNKILKNLKLNLFLNNDIKNLIKKYS